MLSNSDSCQSKNGATEENSKRQKMETDYNNPEDEKLGILGKIFLGAVFLALPVFIIYYIWFENKITTQLEECSFYTVAVPIRMPTQTSMYFHFNYEGQINEDWTSVGAGDLGYSYNRKSAMSTRYWVRVYCKDFKVNRIYWEAKVPDTLQYIPPNGWEEIPYGLGEK